MKGSDHEIPDSQAGSQQVNRRTGIAARIKYSLPQFPPLTSNKESNAGKGIKFGTAGLRARAEAGFSRMNCLTVIQTSQGLAQHILDTKADSAGASIVVGFDGRRDSRRFAEKAAAAFIAYGFDVIWFDDFVHTPLVPFAVRTKGAAAGIMITASHNPKDDNGYKVYVS